MNAFKYFSKNGTILLIDEAYVSLFNIEYAYGFGVYESVRVKNNIPYFVNDHAERLLISAQLVHVDHAFSKDAIISFINDLILEIDQETYNLKILLIGASTPEKTELHILPLAPKFPDKKLYRHGAKVITTYHERLFPRAKSLNMFSSYVAYREAQKQDAYDTLLVDREDRILEGTRTNFFAIKGRTLYTPSSIDVLHGVARRNVIHIAHENKYEVEEKDIYLPEIGMYDGAFLTSTSAKVMPIIQINDFLFDEVSGELKELMKGYGAFLKKSKGVF